MLWERTQILGPIIAATANGCDISPLLAGLREQFTGMGMDQVQIDEFLEKLHGQANPVPDKIPYRTRPRAGPDAGPDRGLLCSDDSNQPRRKRP